MSCDWLTQIPSANHTLCLHSPLPDAPAVSPGLISSFFSSSPLSLLILVSAGGVNAIYSLLNTAAVIIHVPFTLLSPSLPFSMIRLPSLSPSSFFHIPSPPSSFLHPAFSLYFPSLIPRLSNSLIPLLYLPSFFPSSSPYSLINFLPFRLFQLSTLITRLNFSPFSFLPFPFFKQPLPSALPFLSYVLSFLASSLLSFHPIQSLLAPILSLHPSLPVSYPSFSFFHSIHPNFHISPALTCHPYS